MAKGFLTKEEAITNQIRQEIAQHYVTKDSGEREEYSTGMRRDVQDDKPRFDLVVPECIPYEETFLYRWAMLMKRGADKYGDRNWEKAATLVEQIRFKASAARHFFAWLSGKDDEDHGTAVAFNIQGYEMVKYKLEVDKHNIKILKGEVW